MNYGPSRIITCPHCVAQKEVLSLLSGNTSGVVIWSDQYAEYPFYESPSDIQKCPGCNKFYMIEQEMEKPLSPSEIKSLLGESNVECFLIENSKEYNWESSTTSTGNLDFPEILRAIIQLDKELDDNYKKRILYLNYIICLKDVIGSLDGRLNKSLVGCLQDSDSFVFPFLVKSYFNINFPKPFFL